MSLTEGNDPPLDSEIPLIRQIISEEVAGVAALDAQMRGLDDAPTELIAKRAEAMERRLFVLEDTQFWTSIVIPASHLRSDDCSTIEAQLLRSANALLKVYWAVGLRIDAPSLESYEALDWLRPVKGRLSSLKKLEVMYAVDSVPDVFGIAPSLREVYLTDWDVYLLSPAISIPWDQIARYRGGYWSKPQLVILASACNLVHCVVSFQDPFEPDDLPPVTLPRLRSLLIEDPEWLGRLKAPLLESLSCLISQGSHLITLLSFVRSSSCPLKRLVLAECVISPQLIAALRGLPTLTHLLVDSYVEGGHQPAFFDAMTVSRTSSDIICPNLVSFVYGAGEGLFPQDLFLTMVRSRLPRLTWLRVFDTSNNVKANALDAPFQMLRNDGVNAVFLVGEAEDPV
ncbi:hypothetical protein DFH08DRAFT_978949 [Mycena albidolilacea]|uniref:F-box protein n=1 Tax=Mycena albidolilacea TaxID=1033008 RepID=A0AAD6YXI0_9AGAR|nr:hypothetical protein DFH08DRAFT_978949 [Mycena albidolilacea]